jgi:hypothetical protein
MGVTAYKLTEPCGECPFRIGSGFTYRSLVAHASGTFPCHKQCDLDDETSHYVPKANGKTNHCAGALIFLEKQGRPHQMMRIAERLGMYDRRKLNMDAAVVSGPEDCRPEDECETRRLDALMREIDAPEIAALGRHEGGAR